MSEHDMRTLLRDLAMRPEPASTIDITAARRSGKRRLWASRAAISAAVAAVVAAAVVVPQTLSSSAPGRAPVTPPASGAGQQKASPGYLNPLVPYAAFGYLPKGYQLGLIPANHDGFTSTVDGLTLTAAQAGGPNAIELDVTGKGTCGDNSVLLNEIPGYLAAHRNDGPSCNVVGGAGTGVPGKIVPDRATRAADVNGRPAYWVVNGAGLAWEYAPGSWATLEALHGGHDSFPVAEAKALLPKMAATVKFGQTKRVMLPFKLTGAVLSSWRPVSVTYTVTPSGRYLASEVKVSPSFDPGMAGALDAGVVIAAAKTPNPDGYTCPPAKSPASAVEPVMSTVQKDGLSWNVLTSPKTTKVNGKPVPVEWTADEACNQHPDNGQYAFVELVVNPAGSAQAAAAKNILAHVSVASILDHLSLSADAQT